ncbi:unnamed protein product [Merluccius merluccius]
MRDPLHRGSASKRSLLCERTACFSSNSATKRSRKEGRGAGARSESKISRLAQKWNRRSEGDALRPLFYTGACGSSLSLDR